MRPLAVAAALLIPLPLAAAPPAPVDAGVPAGYASATDREAAARLDAVLDRPLPPLDLKGDETPLRDVLTAVADACDIVVRPDEQSLTEEGISIDGPIDVSGLSGNGVSARSALALLLDPVNLTTLNRSGMLVVTTQTTAEERQEARVYNVRDLLEGVSPESRPPSVRGGSSGIPDRDPKPDAAEAQLISLVTITTEGPWIDIEGRGGSLDVYDGLLVVRQSERAHREIAGLLAALREAGGLRPKPGDAKPEP